ncbi:MAG TPA: glycosyltransferase family 2 protein [Saprospiraceae bacterium]|nr:glycosyltransferase family 2 protein [Saprospiraceae bacterium]
MFVSGFSFIRNAVKYDYPVVEAITSVLPLCDEFVIAVGNSDDATLQLIQSIQNPKIKIIETVWDDSLREGGRVLAAETDKAYRAISDKADWCFYIQGDEVLHEKYLENIRRAMTLFKDDKKVDGLLFDYLHFYGSYDFVGSASRWYRREVRVIRKDASFYSYRDAQGFRKGDNQKLNVKRSDAFIYHYGWVRDPRAMQQKNESFHRLWHSDEWVDKNIAKAAEFDYSGIDALEKFEGSHPAVMQERIRRKNWRFDFDISFNSLKLKDRLRKKVEKWTGWRPGEYRNYRLLK